METMPQYERLGRLIYGFHRWVNPTRLRDPQALPPVFAERGRALVARFDAALAVSPEGDGFAVTDAEIVAILIEAEAFARAMSAASGE